MMLECWQKRKETCRDAKAELILSTGERGCLDRKECSNRGFERDGDSK